MQVRCFLPVEMTPRVVGLGSRSSVATQPQLILCWTLTTRNRRPSSQRRTPRQRMTPTWPTAASRSPARTCLESAGRRVSRPTAAFPSRGRDRPVVYRRRRDVAATWPCTATRLRTRRPGRARAASTSACRARAQSSCGAAAVGAQRRRPAASG